MTTALALRVLLAAWPDHPLVVPMGRWLSTARRDGTWRTTHATAHAVLALRDLARLEGDPQATPILARAALPAAPLFAERLGGSAPTALRLTWSLAGRAALAPGGHTTLTLARAPRPRESGGLGVASPALSHGAARDRAPRAGARRRRGRPHPRAAGLSLRSARAPRGGRAAASARTGEVVRLELLLVAPRAVTDVAIEDPLPAGLEPLLLDLETVAHSLGRGLVEREWRGGYDEHDEYGGESADFDYAATGGVFPALRIERRDDRVAAFATALPAGIYRFEYLARAATPGTFAAPPATVELMYDPEMSARTGPLRFTVTPASDREER